METGVTRNEESQASPYWNMHRDIQDVRQGVMTFDELRLVWVAWAKKVHQELENQAAKEFHTDLPDSNSADTTA